jgi:hypothetical protein
MNNAATEADKANDSNAEKRYSSRLAQLEAEQRTDRRWDRRLGAAKLVVAVLSIGLITALLRRPSVLGWTLIPIALFVVLAIAHDRVLGRIKQREMPLGYYRIGLTRLDGSWARSARTSATLASNKAKPGNPVQRQNGERFLDSAHPYARDLDLFGSASLFELLCTARTPAGEATLAAWLLTPATPAVVRERQAAVRELRGRVSFRERLWASGEMVRDAVHPDALAAWGEQPPVLSGTHVRWIASSLAMLWVLSIAAWALLGLGWVASLATVACLVYAYRLYRRVDERSSAMESATKDLEILAEVTALLERETFESTKLTELQAVLRSTGSKPSVAIARLAKLAQYLESRRNPLGRAVDLVTYWTAHLLLAAERWQARHGNAVRGWLAAVGEFEALAALSGYAFEHPEDVFPELVQDGPMFEAEGLAHPLLAVDMAVRNNLALGSCNGAGTQLVIISGPNMAGKSTFIRSIGVNIVLAQMGAPVRARRMVLSPLAVGTSICILDSLQGGASRFYAEISRVKLITELAGGAVPVLFLLDELLSGTNSNDRLAGTDYVVRNLLKQGAIGLVSTHDLALTRLPEALGAVAINCHFEDRLNGEELAFDYRLKPGIVETSNALALMRSIGLGVPRKPLL